MSSQDHTATGTTGAPAASTPSCDPRFFGMRFSGRVTQRIPRPTPSREHIPASRTSCGSTDEWRSADPAFVRFIARILREAGLDITRYRLAPMVRRLPACLRELRVDSLEAAEQLLTRQPSRWTAALNTLLIGTTGFFRDSSTFEALESTVLPDLLARQPHPRIWSAACSDGAELYSIAMLIDEAGHGNSAHLLGTDCRESALRTAREGRFPNHLTEELSPQRMEKYLVRDATSVRISPRLASRIHWQRADVLAKRPAGTWDLILCRNLAIYLRPTVTHRLWQHLFQSLAPGGCLVAGKAEKPGVPGLRRIAPCIYMKPLP